MMIKINLKLLKIFIFIGVIVFFALLQTVNVVEATTEGEYHNYLINHVNSLGDFLLQNNNSDSSSFNINDILQTMALDFKNTAVFYGGKIASLMSNMFISIAGAYTAFIILAMIMKAELNTHEMTIIMAKVFVVGWIMRYFGQFNNLILSPIDRLFNYDVPNFFKTNGGGDFSDLYSSITNQLIGYIGWSHLLNPEMWGAIFCYIVATILFIVITFYIMFSQVKFYLNFALCPFFIFLGLFKTTRSVFMGSITICLTSFGTIIVVNMYVVLIINVLIKILNKWHTQGININNLLSFIIVSILSLYILLRIQGFIQTTFGAALLPPMPSIRNMRGAIRGVNSQGSNKAYDLFMKIQFLQKQKGDNKGVFMATGTPISNSLAELYTISRYMDNTTLHNLGVQHFDSWASMFATITEEWQVSSTGSGFEKSRMFSEFKNLPELSKMYSQYADLVMCEDLQTVVKLPQIEGDEPTNVMRQPTVEQKEYMTQLVDRMTRIKESLVNPTEDNALKICSDGRMSSLDMRLKDTLAEPSEKIIIASTNIKNLYDKYNDDKGTQLVFCDLSTPKNKSDFSIYYDLKDRLIQKGIKDCEIAFIHDYDKDDKKMNLFKQVNSGEVRILIGSSLKMGAGMNVQERLVGLHHLDAPWRPTDLEQREGRIIRQGNKLLEKYGDDFKITINRYATQNMYDSRIWQILENKSKFIHQFRSGNVKLRTGEDISDNEIKSIEEMKAVASGNPYFILYIKIKDEYHKQSLSYNRQQANFKQLKTDIEAFDDGKHTTYNHTCNKLQHYEQILNQSNNKYKFTTCTNNGYYTIKEINSGLILYCNTTQPTSKIIENRSNHNFIDKKLKEEINKLKEDKLKIELDITSSKQTIKVPLNHNKIKILKEDLEKCQQVLNNFTNDQIYWLPKSQSFVKETSMINKYFGKEQEIKYTPNLER